jgi:hypothetical protein
MVEFRETSCPVAARTTPLSVVLVRAYSAGTLHEAVSGGRWKRHLLGNETISFEMKANSELTMT